MQGESKRGQAAILTDGNIRDCVALIGNHRHHARDRALFLLSAMAGLRAGEIAGLRWADVLDGDGALADAVTIPTRIAKRGSGRSVPMAAPLRDALTALRIEAGAKARSDWRVIYSERGTDGLSANVVVQIFGALYRRAGLKGCSSHSGRRTFVTRTARAISLDGGSLRDVMELAGHQSVSTTQRYIDSNENAKRAVVNRVFRAVAANGANQ